MRFEIAAPVPARAAPPRATKVGSTFALSTATLLSDQTPQPVRRVLLYGERGAMGMNQFTHKSAQAGGETPMRKTPATHTKLMFMRQEAGVRGNDRRA
jgi:hypothetical protein